MEKGRKSSSINIILISIALLFISASLAIPNAQTAQDSVVKQLEQKKEELAQVKAEADEVKADLRQGHPGDKRSFLEVVRSDIEFEKEFDEKLKQAKSKAKRYMPLLKRGFGNAKANKKLSPFFTIDGKGNLHWGPTFHNLPALFPAVAISPETAISILDNLIDSNSKKLKEREAQLSTLKKEERLKKKVAELEKQTKDSSKKPDQKSPHLNIKLTGIPKTWVGTPEDYRVVINGGSPPYVINWDFHGEERDTTLLRERSDQQKKVWRKSGEKSIVVTVSTPLREITSAAMVINVLPVIDKLVINCEPKLKSLGKNVYEASIGTEVKFSLTVRYSNGATVDNPEGSKIRVGKFLTKTLLVEETRDYQVLAKFKGISASITVRGVWEENIVRFKTTEYRTKEGDKKTLKLIVQRMGKGRGPVSVRVVPTGNATEGEDYAYAGSVFEWLNNEADERTVDVYIYDDDESEGNEFVDFTLHSPQGAKLFKNSSATITIEDDDISTGKLRFEADNYVVTEGQEKEARIFVLREEMSIGKITVTVETRDDTAKAGKDYDAVSKTLTWLSGEKRPKPIIIPIHDDKDPEGPENLHIVLRDPTGGAKLGKPDAVTLTIKDNEVTH